MLRSFYQNYATLFENIRGTGFLDLSITGAELDLNKAHSLAQLFILSDLLTYVGIVVIVFVIGARYSTSHSAVTELLVKISGFFCYISLFANIFGIFSG